MESTNDQAVLCATADPGDVGRGPGGRLRALMQRRLGGRTVGSSVASLCTVLAAGIVGVGLLELALGTETQRVWLEAPEATSAAAQSLEEAVGALTLQRAHELARADLLER